jgi:hypothetical protein
MSKDTKNGNGNGKAYPVEVWEEIRQEYHLGLLSIAAISRRYGPSRQAIMKKADRLGWHRKLAEDVRNAVQRKGIEAELQQEVTEANYDEAIEDYGKLGAGIIGAHKNLFSRILQQVDVTLSDLTHSQGIMEKLAKGDRVKKVTVMAASLALRERNNLMRTVAHVLDRIIPLQRQAFNLDESGSGSETVTYYIIGDLDKPIDAGMAKLKSA